MPKNYESLWLGTAILRAPVSATAVDLRVPLLRQLYIICLAITNLHAGFEYEAPAFERALHAAALGAVAGIGVLKAGAEAALYRPGLDSPISPLYNFPSLPSALAAAPTFMAGAELVVRIGVFGTGAHKNIATQVFAACSLGKAVEIHTNELPQSVAASVARMCFHPVVQHASAPHHVFQRLLATMDVGSCECVYILYMYIPPVFLHGILWD